MKLPVRVSKALNRAGLLLPDGAPDFDRIAREHAAWAAKEHTRNITWCEAFPALGPATPASVDPGDYLRATVRDFGPKALQALGVYAFSTWGTA